MMRYFLFFTCCFLSVRSISIAQYIPNSSQAFQFVSLYNPAFSGIDPFTNVTVGYRYQWSGLEGAPKSINLSFNTRTKQPLDLVYNTPRSSDLNSFQIPKKKLLIHGMGVNLFTASYGQIQSVGGGLNYALHFAMSKNIRTAVGISAILNNTKVNLDQITLRDPINDQYYNSLVANGSTETQLNLRAGVLLYSHNFYFGLSYFPLFESALKAAEVALSAPFYRGGAQFGFSLPASHYVDIKPSVIALLQMNGGVSLDYTVKAYMQDLLWFGFSYRSIQSGAALFGLNVNQTFALAYSYEMSLGKFKQFNDGSHEIVLSIKLNNFKRQDPYTW